MEIIKVYRQSVPSTSVVVFSLAISDWYCKPAILESLACKLDAKFICCSKYGPRQFLPDYHASFPVHDFYLALYKKHLPWLTIEFNNHGNDSPFGSRFENEIHQFGLI